MPVEGSGIKEVVFYSCCPHFKLLILTQLGHGIVCSLASRTASLSVRRGHMAEVCSLSVCSKLKSPPL